MPLVDVYMYSGSAAFLCLSSAHCTMYFDVENNSCELTRIFKESFIDQR